MKSSPTLTLIARENSFAAHPVSGLRWTRLVLLLACLVPLATAVSRVFYPFDLGNYESVVWEPARLLIFGHNPYDLAITVRPPYTMAAYGPFYYALIGTGIRAFGFQFWFGRALSLLACGICCACIHRLIARQTPDAPLQKTACCLGVAFFLIQMPVVMWSGLQRPDFPALAFALCGLVLAITDNAASAPRFRRLVGASLCFVAAIFCRQTAVSPVVFAVIWHWKVHRAQALWLLGMVAALVVALGVWLQITSQGGFVWLQWILPSASPRSLDSLLRTVELQFTAPVVVVVVLLAFVNRHQANATEIAKPALCWWHGYFLLSTLLSFVTARRLGADVNYWLEPCAIGAIVAALTLVQCGLSRRLWQTMLCGIALSCGVLASMLGREEQLRWQGLPYLLGVVTTLRKFVPRAEPVASVYVDLVIAAGRTPWFNDPYQYAYSPRHRQIFTAVIRSRRLGALLGGQPAPPGYQRVEVAPSLADGQTHDITLKVRTDLLK